MGTNFIEHYACRAEGPDRSRRRASWGTSCLGDRIYQGAGILLLADARFDSRSFSEGWCPGARIITKLSWEQE